MLQEQMTGSSISSVQCSSSVFPEETVLRSSRNGRLHRKNGRGKFTDNCYQKPYVLVFDGDVLPEERQGAQKIVASTFEEVLCYIGILGETSEVYLSKDFENSNPLLSRKVKSITYRQAEEYVQNHEVDTELGKFINRIPLDIASLMHSPLAMKEDDAVAPVLDKRYVHKKKDANILISDYYSKGNFLYFNMYDQTREIQFDHDSDHVQGLLLLEAMRQASIATTHISGGLPEEGTIALLTYDSGFYNFLELTAPIVVRTYTPFSFNSADSNGDVFVSCEIFQWGKLASSALLKGKAFPDKSRYVNYRIRTEKVQARHKKQYDSKIMSVQNTVGVI
ncbi:AfsA-related hotdog domain-containing protein [Prosthecochloris sp.]|uniref:AfsA-related hotdog domain-containing protein n=1 Tax=Prosthecochloris sp. TaxID=290513 RepID=UPI0025F6969B|nr:AfsA-related hotdog domain-containing protein [Prosthecochloris sp.]